MLKTPNIQIVVIDPKQRCGCDEMERKKKILP